MSSPRPAAPMPVPSTGAGAARVFAVVAGEPRGSPRDVFVLVGGICRWTVRAVACAALMRDECPPLRLGR